MNRENGALTKDSVRHNYSQTFYRGYESYQTHAHSRRQIFGCSLRSRIPGLFALEICARKCFCPRCGFHVRANANINPRAALVCTRRCNKVVETLAFIVPPRVISVSSRTEARLGKASRFVFRVHKSATREAARYLRSVAFLQRRVKKIKERTLFN